MIWASSHSLTLPQVIQLPEYLNPSTLFSSSKLWPINCEVTVRNSGIKRQWHEKVLIFILWVAQITKPRLFQDFTHFCLNFHRFCWATHGFIAVFPFISLPLRLLALFSVVERLRQRVRALLASYVPYQPLQPSHRANPAYFDNVWSPGWCWLIVKKFFFFPKKLSYCLNHRNVNFWNVNFWPIFREIIFFSFENLRNYEMKLFSSQLCSVEFSLVQF